MIASMKKSFTPQQLEEILARHQSEGLEAQDFGLRVDREGNWFHHGVKIERISLVKTFASILLKCSEGKYWLVNPAEYGEVIVEDAPFIATQTHIIGKGEAQEISFTTNLDEKICLDSEHPLSVLEGTNEGEPRPYIIVRGRVEARLARPAFYALTEVAEKKDGVIGVYSKGQFFSLEAS